MKKQLLAGSLSLILAVATVGSIAFAKSNENDHKDKNDAHSVGSTLEVHIGDDGNVLVRGAKVTAINGSAITATTAWGSASLTWTVNTNASTNLVRRFGGDFTSLSEIATGDLISFTGPLNTTAGQLTVTAKTLKDWSIQQARANFKGTVSSVNASAQSFALQTKERGTITVMVNSSTSITRAGTVVVFADVKAGDQVEHTSGLYDNASHILRAEVIKFHAAKPALLNRRTFEGTLKSIASTTAPTTFVLTLNGNADYTVNVPTGISIINKLWAATPLSGLHVGDKLRVYGAIEAAHTTTIDATVIRDISI